MIIMSALFLCHGLLRGNRLSPCGLVMHLPLRGPCLNPAAGAAHEASNARLL